MLKAEFRAMGCGITVLLDNEDSRAFNALQQVPAWFEEWEQALSRFRPDSELNRLNHSAGSKFLASPILWEVLNVALENAAWSAGLVVPTILKSLEEAGYISSFNPSRPGAEYSRQTTATFASDEAWKTGQTGWGDIRLDQSRLTITIPA
ncbi:MAG TPA: FAD:protein FMN transferase, partial [Anaerolineaceae bacterium]|nr:FAD:protein FMN transferase [Anaerolineaceae bacterium]